MKESALARTSRGPRPRSGTVAVAFPGVFFWGWLWKIPRAPLAVPMLATFKIFCDHVPVLSPVGAFLAR